MELPNLEELSSRIVAIYSDSRVTLALLKNNSMHSFLIEEIRNKVQHLNS
jgi:ArsR family metal-binding transcriptional regulator